MPTLQTFRRMSTLTMDKPCGPVVASMNRQQEQLGVQRADQGGSNMSRIGRRKFLKLSGTGALAARAGGLAAILATGKAPPYAQGTTLHWLRWNDFIPQSDALLKNQIAPQCAKDLGIT